MSLHNKVSLDPIMGLKHSVAVRATCICDNQTYKSFFEKLKFPWDFIRSKENTVREIVGNSHLSLVSDEIS